MEINQRFKTEEVCNPGKPSLFKCCSIKWNQQISIAPLVSFRIIFGLLMCFSLIRFWWRGWIEAVYILPKFHFNYWGFEWVTPLGNPGMYILFAIIVISTILITLGLFYRIAAITFFLGFTYVELIDVTTYLNHYYFISLVAFIMIWLPANRFFSLDAYLRPSIKKAHVSLFTVGMLRFQLAIVYIFAGLAKLNYDWLILAEPMRTWLPAKSHLPVVGKYMYEEWVAYLFSWFGAIYDSLIVFFLLNRKTRSFAYVFVLIFHVATAIFFPGIGMFPYVMIASTLIFFSSDFHKKLLFRLTGDTLLISAPNSTNMHRFRFYKPLYIGMSIYIFLQIIIPLRFLFYPDHLFWSEEGYRFSWRVMLMEKAGNAIFRVKDADKIYEVNNAQFLTPLQEKMMSTQPDLILKYAHHLADEYKKRDIKKPEVYGEIYVTLNGTPSQLFIDSTVNLAQRQLSWKHYNWILPYTR
ncbi:MAG: HTTM domain-containing protein [Chitinophagaceae bacterium]|nr:HTTM domain-containing protein [Chitinophagaceae bacterium]